MRRLFDLFRRNQSYAPLPEEEWGGDYTTETGDVSRDLIPAGLTMPERIFWMAHWLYPSHGTRLPYGAFVRISEEVGCSRAYVGKVLGLRGYTTKGT